MEVIAAEEIENAWNEMEDLEAQDIPKLVDALRKSQPNVLVYLMGTGSDILNRGEREALMFMGLMIWQIVSRSSDFVPKISSEILESYEIRNLKMLEYLAGEPEQQFMQTVERIMANYHQADLLRFFIDRLLEEPEMGVDIRGNNVGMIAIYLKTLIDCLDNSRQDRSEI